VILLRGNGLVQPLPLSKIATVTIADEKMRGERYSFLTCALPAFLNFLDAHSLDDIYPLQQMTSRSVFKCASLVTINPTFPTFLSCVEVIRLLAVVIFMILHLDSFLTFSNRDFFLSKYICIFQSIDLNSGSKPNFQCSLLSFFFFFRLYFYSN
jgi:hypothetical protein